MNPYATTKSKLILASKGLAMGAADVVPGVSGGTIAFISGIYEQLITAISSVRPVHALSFAKLLLFWRARLRREAIRSLSEIHWSFLLPLISGIAAAILLMSRVVPYLMREYPFYTYSLFFGLIAFSIPMIFKRMDHTAGNYVVLALFTVGMFLFMGEHENLDGSTSLPYVFISGAIAICAMILPGISGSYILVLMGQYLIVLDALHTLDIPVLIAFITGMGTGILSFTRLLKYLLAHHHSFTMAALTGIMVGSLRKMWPGNFVPEGGAEPVALAIAAGAVLLGGIAIFALTHISEAVGDPAAPSSH